MWGTPTFDKEPLNPVNGPNSLSHSLVSINPVRDILGRVTKDKLSYFKVHFGVTEKCHIGIEHAHIILITQGDTWKFGPEQNQMMAITMAVSSICRSCRSIPMIL